MVDLHIFSMQGTLFYFLLFPDSNQRFEVKFHIWSKILFLNNFVVGCFQDLAKNIVFRLSVTPVSWSHAWMYTVLK